MSSAWISSAYFAQVFEMVNPSAPMVLIQFSTRLFLTKNEGQQNAFLSGNSNQQIAQLSPQTLDLLDSFPVTLCYLFTPKR